jgi:prolyl-tRNA synthetase
MRQSQHLGITLKNAPREAQTDGHKLLVRAGYIRQAAPGIHVVMTYLLRVLNKLERICRAELAAASFEEFALPLLVPAAFRQAPEAAGMGNEPETGLFTFKDRRGSVLSIGSGSAGLAAAVASREIRSYKDLPKRLFQIQKQFRDEPRSRAALVDDREFRALEAFGFDPDENGSAAAYRAMQAAVDAVCKSAGLAGRWVEADVEAESAGGRHEWVAAADAGEEAVVACDACGYAAGRRAGQSRLEVFTQDAEMRPMEAVYGPGLIGVGPLAEFIGIPVWKTTKTLLFQADDQLVAVMVRGDCDVSEDKVRRHLKCCELTLASPQAIKELTGAEVGYAGGVGLPPKVVVLADHFTRDRLNFECGANRTDYHNINVNWGRDLPLPTFGDFKTVREGEFCPRCDPGRIRESRGVRVADLSRLSASLSATSNLSYQDKAGKPQPVRMATCRVNLSSLTAALIEQHHDDKGIRWPARVAPFHVHLIGLNLEDEGVRDEAERIYRQLVEEKIEVLFDDRGARAGEKFSDSDLLGIPVRLTISKRTLKEGKIELKLRDCSDSESATVEEALKAINAACV